jgi:hypothetical protein
MTLAFHAGITFAESNASPQESSAAARMPTNPDCPTDPAIPLNLTRICENSLKQLPRKADVADLFGVCQSASLLTACQSRNGEPIFHFDRQADKSRGLRILCFAVMHGDEALGGSIAAAWAARLARISPRNTWRIIPVLNPDGLGRGTRTTANGVDINRNFPTRDFESQALSYWRNNSKENPGKYPGATAASESETRCALQHIETFAPDMIVAIHTPLGLLDFDGPRVKPPRNTPLPWVRLGHYPGSLGRYMWHERGTPVLTIELKGAENLDELDHLQDISGFIARLSKDRG